MPALWEPLCPPPRTWPSLHGGTSASGGLSARQGAGRAGGIPVLSWALLTSQWACPPRFARPPHYRPFQLPQMPFQEAGCWLWVERRCPQPSLSPRQPRAGSLWGGAGRGCGQASSVSPAGAARSRSSPSMSRPPRSTGESRVTASSLGGLRLVVGVGGTEVQGGSPASACEPLGSLRTRSPDSGTVVGGSMGCPCRAPRVHGQLRSWMVTLSGPRPL